MILTILLITFIIVLFFTVRRNFGKELKRQLNLITFVYFFFQLGYLFKFGVLLYCLISVRSVEDLEKHQTQILLSLVPLISQMLPIFILFVHHCKNFRPRQQASLDKEQQRLIRQSL